MSIERDSAVTLKGNPITLVGPELKVGDKARKRTNRSSLSKSSEMTFTGQIFDIVEVIPGSVNKEPKYLIDENKDPQNESPNQ